MIPEWLFAHLWQSTAVGAMIWLLTLALRNHTARTRYWLWLAASLKFVVPFSLLSSAGSRLGAWLLPIHIQPRVFVFMEQISGTVLQQGEPMAAATQWGPIFIAIWIAGTLAVLCAFLLRWCRVATVVRDGQPIRHGRALQILQRVRPGAAIPLIATSSGGEPGVFGIWRPLLLLPEGILDRLTDAQLEAVMAHELAHIDRRDNLAALLHTLIEAAFWFHPLVWWLGTRMLAEREHACDEQVLRRGSEPQAYAEAILHVCNFCLEAPLACVAGVTGADLKERIERIASRRVGSDLTKSARFLLVACAVLALAGPLCFGVLSGDALADTPEQVSASAKFEFAELERHPATSGQRSTLFISADGHVTVRNLSLKQLLAFAYDVREFQIEGNSDNTRFDIAAAAKSTTLKDPALRVMMRRLLRDRLGVRVHSELRRLPAYELTVAPGGPKLIPATGNRRIDMRIDNGRFEAHRLPVSELAKQLSALTHRVVVDRTGISGDYDFELSWKPSTAIASSLEPQLGLRLRDSVQSVTLLIIDGMKGPPILGSTRQVAAHYERN